ncbi:hypothetical protein B0H15DRAFT_807238 [Mycena belliarum]|uniref:Uncharacterized protein n=1 Tax=Mycena belliarum TaxID=1033014 RepID=A0AAD6TLK4_9AGAR|nr:hypothetical protein B0H15DRAFT_807238 [Mycena belliae]
MPSALSAPPWASGSVVTCLSHSTRAAHSSRDPWREGLGIERLLTTMFFALGSDPLGVTATRRRCPRSGCARRHLDRRRTSDALRSSQLTASFHRPPRAATAENSSGPAAASASTPRSPAAPMHAALACDPPSSHSLATMRIRAPPHFLSPVHPASPGVFRTNRYDLSPIYYASHWDFQPGPFPWSLPHSSEVPPIHHGASIIWISIEIIAPLTMWASLGLLSDLDSESSLNFKSASDSGFKRIKDASLIRQEQFKSRLQPFDSRALRVVLEYRGYSGLKVLTHRILSSIQMPRPFTIDFDSESVAFTCTQYYTCDDLLDSREFCFASTRLGRFWSQPVTSFQFWGFGSHSYVYCLAQRADLNADSIQDRYQALDFSAERLEFLYELNARTMPGTLLENPRSDKGKTPSSDIVKILRSNMGETMPECPATPRTPELWSSSLTMVDLRRLSLSYGPRLKDIFDLNHARSHPRGAGTKSIELGARALSVNFKLSSPRKPSFDSSINRGALRAPQHTVRQSSPRSFAQLTRRFKLAEESDSQEDAAPPRARSPSPARPRARARNAAAP